MDRRLRFVALIALLLFPAGLVAARRERGPVILCYHIVESPKNSEHAITRAAFQSQMAFLADAGYHVISLRELNQSLEAGVPLPLNSVVITVDDGWRSTLTEILPEMKRRNFPFSVFIYPRFIGGGGPSLSWDDVRKLQAGGAEIESHTMSHPFLTRKRQRHRSRSEYERWLWNELTASRKKIERETGATVQFLAYPYGDFDRHVEAVTAAAGYKAALTCNEGPIISTANRFTLRRFAIDHSTSLDQFSRYLAYAGPGSRRAIGTSAALPARLAATPRKVHSKQVAMMRHRYIELARATVATASESPTPPDPQRALRRVPSPAILPSRIEPELEEEASA